MILYRMFLKHLATTNKQNDLPVLKQYCIVSTIIVVHKAVYALHLNPNW